MKTLVSTTFHLFSFIVVQGNKVLNVFKSTLRRVGMTKKSLIYFIDGSFGRQVKTLCVGKWRREFSGLGKQMCSSGNILFPRVSTSSMLNIGARGIEKRGRNFFYRLNSTALRRLTKPKFPGTFITSILFLLFSLFLLACGSLSRASGYLSPDD